MNANIAGNAGSSSDSDSDSDSDGNDGRNITVEFEEFNDLIKPYVERIVNLTTQALQIGNMSENEIDKVILVGGSSRLRSVQEALRRKYGNKVEVSNNPDECVARGALRASAYVRDRIGLNLKQVIPEYYSFPIYDDYTHRE